MLDRIVASAPLYLLVAARCFTLIMTLPLFSSRTVPRIAKVALAFYLSYFVFNRLSLSSSPFASYTAYITSSGNFNLEYILLLLGEGIIGLIIGFFVAIIFGAFSTAGQFFAFQMGFSAAEAYDALSQVENPLMGQYLNFLAMLVFLNNRWFQKLFINGLNASFDSLNAFSVATNTKGLMTFMLSGLSSLFYNAMIIALPLMGTLFLINVAMGILSKAAPQMNLLSEGFPVLMLTAFFVITALMPDLLDLFEQSFEAGFHQLQNLFIRMGGKT